MAEFFEKEKLCDWCLNTGPSYCDICVMNRHDLPAADVRPVVRGKWEVYDADFNSYSCSACGEPFTLNDGTPQENNMHFCPNCGADMREKKET